MKDRIETIIRDWLNITFNNPNALPKPILSGLAEEIDKHRWEIYRYTKDEYDMEDIETLAENEGVELTADEKSIVLHRYQNSEYQDMDTLSYLVHLVIKERERRDDSEKRESDTDPTQ